MPGSDVIHWTDDDDDSLFQMSSFIYCTKVQNMCEFIKLNKKKAGFL